MKGIAGEHRGQGQRVAGIERVAASDRPQTAAIVVADCRSLTIVATEGAHVARQTVDGVAECRQSGGVTDQLRDEKGHAVEVERVSMVRSRELDVSTVGEDLPVDLLEEHRPAGGHPLTASPQFRQRGAHDIERQRLAREMRIRTEVARQVTLDVIELEIESNEDVDEPAGVRVMLRRLADGAGASRNWIAASHRERAEGELQRAGPVDANQRRIRVTPAAHMLDDASGVAVVLCQPIRAAECQKVLVAIQFPDHFVIAAGGIQKRDVGPESARCRALVHRIEMPVHAAAVAGE